MQGSDYVFYFAQFFGLLALIVLIISFQNNRKDKLLKYQIFSSLFYTLQYLFLKAYSGGIMHLISLLRNLVFIKYKKNIPLLYLFSIIILVIIFSIITYNGVISLIPGFAIIIYSIAIWQKNLTITRIIDVISCLVFIFYNIYVNAYVGIITTSVEMISAIIGIIRFDVKKLKKD